MSLPENDTNSRILLDNVAPPVPSSDQEGSTSRQVQSELLYKHNENEPSVAPHSEIQPTLEIYRTTNEFSASLSDLNISIGTTEFPYIQNRSVHGIPSSPCCPPSYSVIMKQDRPDLGIRREVRSMEMQHLSPFMRIPPPSYADIDTGWSQELSNISSEQILFGPDPMYLWCARCGTIVISITHSEKTKYTHAVAAVLCLFGCWPCAVLPYTLNSCKQIYHYCPDCNYLFGMYQPW